MRRVRRVRRRLIIMPTWVFRGVVEDGESSRQASWGGRNQDLLRDSEWALAGRKIICYAAQCFAFTSTIPLEALIFVAFSFGSEGGNASMSVFLLSAMMTICT